MKPFRNLDYKIKQAQYAESKDLRLEKTYELCVHELGLQQSKRDQIIAFYLAIVSFALPSILKMELLVKIASFLGLYVLGTMLVQVIVRYRIYKEVYWITSRTISSLYHFKDDAITKDLVQHIFYRTMKMSAQTVLVLKRSNHNIHRWKTYRKIQNSAETILYKVLLLMSTAMLWIGVYLLLQAYVVMLLHIWAIVAATVISLINYIYWSYFYYKRLTAVYAVILDDQDESFNATYSKAWFLHSFY